MCLISRVICERHILAEGSVCFELGKHVGMETIPVGDVFCVPSGQTPCHSDHTHLQTITALVTIGRSADIGGTWCACIRMIYAKCVCIN